MPGTFFYIGNGGFMEIIIVGAGPAGCYTGQLLKSMGFQPVLVEEHLSLGQPVHCAGIVSKDFLTLLKPFLGDDVVIKKINGFVINTPWQETFSIKKEDVAAVLDREKLELDLGKGLDINLGERVTSVSQNKDKYLVQTASGKKYEADILIGADGVNSLVRKFLLQNCRKDINKFPIPLNYYFGLQYEIRLSGSGSLRDITSDDIQVFFRSDVPFFIWMFWENDHTIKAGMITNQSKNILPDFIKDMGIKGKIVNVLSGRIPVGFIPTSFQQIALVGDAAGQVKSLTGGGLSFGLQSAHILANCIRQGKLDQYDKRWKKKFSPEIKFGWKAWKIYEGLDEEQRRDLFGIFRRNVSFIENMLDYDHHSNIFKKVYERPQLLKDVGKLFHLYLEELLNY